MKRELSFNKSGEEKRIRFYARTVPPSCKNSRGYLIIPGSPLATVTEHEIEEVVDLFLRPELGFKVKLKGLNVIINIHWITAIALRPYSKLNEYFYNLRHSPNCRKLLGIHTHPIFDFIPCIQHLWTKSLSDIHE